MQPEEAQADLVRQWLTKAEHDVLIAEQLVTSPVLADGVSFHCQQAAEKALKAFLTWHSQPFGKTHNLRVLVLACEDISAEFGDLLDAADILTPYAIAGRYPDDLISPTQAEAAEALRLAKEVVQVVRDQLPSEVQP